MGVEKVEKILKRNDWLDAKTISEKANINISNTRILLNKLVNNWGTAECEERTIDKRNRRFYRLK